MPLVVIPAIFALLVLSATAAAAQTGAAPEAAACNDAGIITRQLRCFLDAAEAAGDPAVCEAAAQSPVRFNCLSLYAEHSGDVAPCRRITDPGGGQTAALRGACVAGVAVATRAPALCEPIEHATLRDTCFMTLVVERGADRALCTRIDTPALRKICTDPPATAQ